MSLNAITLNSKEFVYRSAAGREVVRGVTTATLPAGILDSELTIAHAPGKGMKADRHVIKITRTIAADDGTPVQMGMHVVLTVPKKLSKASVASSMASTGSISDDLADILAADTFEISRRLINNEFE